MSTSSPVCGSRVTARPAALQPGGDDLGRTLLVPGELGVGVEVATQSRSSVRRARSTTRHRSSAGGAEGAWTSTSVTLRATRSGDRRRPGWRSAAAVSAAARPTSTASRTSARMAATSGDRRSRCSSSSRTSAQVNSSRWSALFASSPSAPEASRWASTCSQTPATPVAGQGRAGDDRGGPGPGAPAVHQAERTGQLPGRGTGLLLPLDTASVVRLVEGDHVGELEDALLDALELVAGPGQRQEQEGVDHPRDGDLRLSDADRLDEHDVVRRRLQHQHRLAVARATPPRVPALGLGRM